jgi:hypothetical protein
MARVPNIAPRVETPIHIMAETSYTLTNTDHGRIIDCTSDSDVTITVPSGLRGNFGCWITRSGDGTVTIVEGTDVTINAIASATIDTVYDMRRLIAFRKDTYRLFTTGNGGGSSSVTAPQLPSTATLSVIAGLSIGDSVGSISTVNNPSPAPSWSMTAADGLTINVVTGDITISDDTAFYAALPADIVTTVTASNSAGSAQCVLTIVEEAVSPPYNFGNSPWSITPLKVAYTAATGTATSDITQRVPDSTITPSVSSVLLANGAVGTTGQLVFGTPHGVTRYAEPGRYEISVTETVSPDSRSLDTELFLLPTGVTYGQAWTPFVSDQYLSNGWVQEDLADGPVSSWPNRGGMGATYNAVQTANTSYRPTKLAGTGGVEFSAITDQHLYIAPDQQKCFDVRCTLTVFRYDKATATTPGSTWICGGQMENTGSAVTTRIISGIQVQSLGDQMIMYWMDARGSNTITVKDVHPNYATWCFVVHYHIDGKMYVKVNGEDAIWHGYDTFVPTRASDPAWPSFMGWSAVAKGSTSGNLHVPYTTPGSSNTSTARFAIDCRLEFGEVSEEFIAKLERWAANRAGLTLPDGHKYKVTSPVVDESDFPLSQVKFNHPEWRRYQVAWENRTLTRGTAIDPAETTDYDTLIYKEDFREQSIVSYLSTTPANLYINGGAAGNTIGQNAQITTSLSWYPWSGGQQTLNCTPTVAALLSSVDHMDNGHTLKLKDVWVRVRFKMDVVDTVTNNVWFHCPMWFYTHTRARRAFNHNYELDIFEIENGSPNSKYANVGTFHNHPGAVKQGVNGRHPNNSDPDPYGSLTGSARNRLLRKFGEYMDSGLNANWNGAAIDQADGNFHIIDMICGGADGDVIFAIDDREVWRMARPQQFDFSYFMLINTAYRGVVGGNVGATSSITLDYIEIRKPAATIEVIPSNFTARPTISGTTYVGETLTVDPNLDADAGTQYRVEWYHEDGYPISREKSGSLILSSDEIGKQIRAKVITVGHWEDQEAWSDLTAVVDSGGDPITTMDLNFADDTYTINGTPYATFALARAAIQGMIFTAAGTRSMVSQVSAIPTVAANTPRVDSRGLIYEDAKVDAGTTNTTVPPGISGLSTVVDAAAFGTGLCRTVYETSTATAERRVAAQNFGTVDALEVVTIAATLTIKKGIRTWVMAEGPFQGAGKTYYDINNMVTGTVFTGITASIEEIPDAPDFCILKWSRTFTNGAIALDNANVSWYLVSGNGAGYSSYSGIPSSIACYFAGCECVITGATSIAIPHYGPARPAEAFQIPCGPGGKTLDIDLLNPVTAATSSTSVVGTDDYTLPIQAQPIITRIQIT